MNKAIKLTKVIFINLIVTYIQQKLSIKHFQFNGFQFDSEGGVILLGGGKNICR